MHENGAVAWPKNRQSAPFDLLFGASCVGPHLLHSGTAPKVLDVRMGYEVSTGAQGSRKKYAKYALKNKFVIVKA